MTHHIRTVSAYARLWTLLVTLFAAVPLATPASIALAEEDPESHQHHDDHDAHDERHHEDEEHDEGEHGFEMEEHRFDMEMFMIELETYQILLEMVNRFTEIAAEPETAAVAAVMGVEEHAEPERVADFFEDVLADTTNPIVERAIRLKLVDVYAQLDDREAVFDQLRTLIASANGEDERHDDEH
mgnify:FL=1